MDLKRSVIPQKVDNIKPIDSINTKLPDNCNEEDYYRELEGLDDPELKDALIYEFEKDKPQYNQTNYNIQSNDDIEKCPK